MKIQLWLRGDRQRLSDGKVARKLCDARKSEFFCGLLYIGIHFLQRMFAPVEFKGCSAVQLLFSYVLSFQCLLKNLRLDHFNSPVSVSPSRLSKYISLRLLLQKSINHSVDFGNLVPSLAVFRSLSYFRASTYTACIKIK